ncbi:MAG: OmpH family outer membrane protein [Bacteroidales bacterium]|nr:OmpH family outer membrane protein [Bacteroidales bacterium]MCF8387098.1 OmpH family outer membrane protein [Bacteroidales bacterium]MCF8397412.1 OmpH family outer membrane protein [Bacteroidales bacterium]
MKKLFRIIALLTLIIGAGSIHAQTDLKFGYIDSNKLLELMPGRDTVQQQLQAYQKELQNTINAMYTEYEAKVQDFQSNQATMSEIIKKTKEKEINDLITRIQDFEQNADYDYQAKQQELFNPLLEKARNAIKAVAEENGYTYIFDSSIGVLLYYEKGDNVLPLVKKKLGL